MRIDMQLHQRRSSAEDQARGKKKPPSTAQGLLTVFTGTGKGKSTAAFGMAWRAIAHNMKVGVVQFLGGAEDNADYRTLGRHPLCSFHIFGAQCQWKTEQLNYEKAQMVAAWIKVRAMMDDPAYGLIICDEINPVIRDQYLNLSTLRQELKERRPGLHMVFTGRNAPFELLDMADLVTDMKEIRHPFMDKKTDAQAGVDY